MPSLEEIKAALGTMDKPSTKTSLPQNAYINEDITPTAFSQDLFAPIEKMENEIPDRDETIEN